MNNNIFVGQSGGPSSAINASLSGVISAAFENAGIGKVYGLKNGIEGLINDNIIDLEFLKDGDNLELLKCTPSAYLGSCRYKLAENSNEDYEKIFKNFDKYNVGFFFYIGGNDSMDTVSKLAKYAKDNKIDIKFMGVPKTIDNDLAVTDHTPGYGSAAKYIATSVKEVMFDAGVYDKPMITIVEMMGRHTGWLTAAASLALSEGESSNEMMIFLPETVFDMDLFVKDVCERMKTTKKLLIAISEGLRLSTGQFICETGHSTEKDAFGHVTLCGCTDILENALRKHLKVKYRSFKLDILQRCAGHLSSLTDINESVESGAFAVLKALEGESEKMVCYVRESDEPYKISFRTADVHQICNVEKMFPLEWITEDKFVTEDFIKYARPLIMGENNIKTENGVPKYLKMPN